MNASKHIFWWITIEKATQNYPFCLQGIDWTVFVVIDYDQIYSRVFPYCVVSV